MGVVPAVGHLHTEKQFQEPEAGGASAYVNVGEAECLPCLKAPEASLKSGLDFLARLGQFESSRLISTPI